MEPSRRHWVLASAALARGYVVLGREPVVIGRGKECDLPLFSDTVSRRHAKVWREGVRYVVQDLGSANGTFVNGNDAARPVGLEHDDVITVGTIQLKFHVLDCTREDLASRFSQGIEETDLVVKKNAGAALFSGQVTREVFYQVCQLVEFHRHSGVLRIESGGCAGYLRFKEGVIVDGRFGQATGERAARAILAIPGGEYAFYATKERAPDGPLKLQARALVMDVLRREEEETKGSDQGLVDRNPLAISDVADAKAIAELPTVQERPIARTKRLPRQPRPERP